MDDNGTKIYHVDKDGDVIFVVGPDKQKVQVLSAVFALASPVFKTMLSPVFSEGRQLAENRAQHKTTDIFLPEDDFESMLFISTILHFRMKPEKSPASPDLALQVAVVADKYNLVPALAHATETWLRKLYDGIPSDNQLSPSHCKILWKLIVCTVFFRKTEHFRDFTRTMILRGEAIEKLSLDQHTPIGEKLELKLLSTMQIQKLTRTILVARLMLWVSGERLGTKVSERCTCAYSTSIVRNFLTESSGNNTPWPDKTSLLSFVEEHGNGASSISGFQEPIKRCDLCTDDIKSKRGFASEKVTKAIADTEGLCLGCIIDEVDGRGSGEKLHHFRCNAPGASPQTSS